jgi:hypothetical protein
VPKRRYFLVALAQTVGLFALLSSARGVVRAAGGTRGRWHDVAAGAVGAAQNGFLMVIILCCLWPFALALTRWRSRTCSAHTRQHARMHERTLARALRRAQDGFRPTWT